jgi:S1-C subfamily serine protease
MQRAGVTSLLLALSLLFGACDEVYPPQTFPPEKTQSPLPWYMEGFSLVDEQTQELAVGELITDTGCGIGSAVLISPQIIITAGHCVDGDPVQFFKAGCELYRIKEYRLHPKYKIGKTVFMDVAIAVLETPCPSTPIRLLNENNVYSRGEPLTIIGFGGGYKRKSNPFVFWYYGTLIETPSVLKMLPIQGTIYFGDSGGAVIDSVGRLVGIVSSLAINHAGVYENSAVRLDLILDWIKNTAIDLSGVAIQDSYE